MSEDEREFHRVTGYGALESDHAQLTQENEQLRARIAELEALILRLHGEALPATWAYTDALTTVELAIAECSTLRTERDRLREALNLLEFKRRSDGTYYLFYHAPKPVVVDAIARARAAKGGVG